MNSMRFPLAVAAAALALTVPSSASAATCKPGTLPDKACTPGAATTTDARTVCSSSFRYSPISATAKRKVFRAYGISRAKQPRYVVDQLIPGSLGGTRTAPNLFPQSKSNAARKNKVEVALRTAACRGEIELATAQQLLASDWLSAYRRFFA